MYFVYTLRAKNQGRTKEEPRNDLRTPKLKKCVLLILPFLLPCLIPPTDDRRDDRQNSDSTPSLQKSTFLKIGFLKKLFPFLKRLTRILKLLTIFLKSFTPLLKRVTHCCPFRAHLLLRFTSNKYKKMHFSAKKVHFSLHTDKF